MSATELELEKGLKPVTPAASTLIGLAVSIIAGLLLAMLLRLVSDNFFEFDPWIGTLIFWVSWFGLAAEIFVQGKCHSIETGEFGIPRFLGGRVGWFVLLEGSQWMIPWLMDKLRVNGQVQTTPEKTLMLVSKEGIAMEGGYIIVYQVINPFKSFNATKPIASLEEIADGALKDAFASQDEPILRTPEQRNHMSKTITDMPMLQERAKKFGYKVDVVVTKAQPPQAILDANAQKSVEEAQKGSEKTEIDGVIENIRKLRADDIGFSAEKAYEILGAERNKTPTQRQIFKLEGVEPIVDKLVPLAEKLIERIFNQDSNKTGGS